MEHKLNIEVSWFEPFTDELLEKSVNKMLHESFRREEIIITLNYEEFANLRMYMFKHKGYDLGSIRLKEELYFFIML